MQRVVPSNDVPALEGETQMSTGSDEIAGVLQHVVGVACVLLLAACCAVALVADAVVAWAFR